MASPFTDVRRLFEGVAIAAAGSATRSIPIRGAKSFSFSIFGTLGGGTAAITYSARALTGATAVTADANLVHIGCQMIQTGVNGNIGTTGATSVYAGIQPASGTPAGITGHNFDVIVTITGGTGAVIDGYAVVNY